MKITKIVLMLIVGMVVSFQALAFELPVADKITNQQSIYVAPKVTGDLELDFRPDTLSGNTIKFKVTDNSTLTTDALAAHNGGKVEIGWRKVTSENDT